MRTWIGEIWLAPGFRSSSAAASTWIDFAFDDASRCITVASCSAIS
jgi:hypothetical protein